MSDLEPHDSTDPLFLAVVDALNAETSMGDWMARDLARRLTPRIRHDALAIMMTELPPWPPETSI